jgi:uncharacterized protein YuzE
MSQSLKNIEWSGKVGEPMYFRFSSAPVATTESHAGGEVNVDLDGHDEVVGVELLSGDAEDFSVFLKIAQTRGLDLAGVHLAPHLVAQT